MPLTDEQKAYLIFKEFVGLSDDVLLGEDGDLLGMLYFSKICPCVFICSKYLPHYFG